MSINIKQISETWRFKTIHGRLTLMSIIEEIE